MYIDEIYELMDEVFDKIFYNYVEKNKNDEIIMFEKICKEKNFRNNQKDVNEMMYYLFGMIDSDKIHDIVKKDSNVELIKGVLNKFIFYYIFIFIGIFYEYSVKDYNSNLIEISKEQANYDIKLSNYFTSESTSILIKCLALVKNFYDYLNSKKTMNDVIPKGVVDFIAEYGKVDVLEKYMKENKKDVKLQYHVLIKLIISVNIFTDVEKKYLFDEIESNELSISEYMFIEIVVPKRDYIDITDIENILSPEDIEFGYANIIYDMINSEEYEEIEKIRSYAFQYDMKIIKLFEYGICVPIVDDFMLYHKDYYKYEKKDYNKSDYIKKKEDTKIKYIVNKINSVKDYYKNKELAKLNLYPPLMDKMAVLVNADEMYKIRSSMENIIKFDSVYLDYVQDLEEYDDYPFISFKDYEEAFFVLSTNNTIDALRNVNFKNDVVQNFKTLQTRVITNNMYVNVVGFAITDMINDFSSQNISKYKKVENDILEDIKKTLKGKIDVLLNGGKTKKNNYYYFDKHMEKLYVQTGVDDSNEKVKILLSSIFDYAISLLFETIKDKFVGNDCIKNYELFLQYCRKYEELQNSNYSKMYNDMLYKIIYEQAENKYDLEDKNDSIIHGFGDDVILLKSLNEEIIKKTDTCFMDLSYKKRKNIIVENNYKISSNAVCQHNVTWEKINKNNVNELYSFLYKFAYKNKFKTYVCKSCGYVLDIKKYEFEQSFDSKFQTHEFVELTYSGSLEEMQEYSKYDDAIKSIKKFIERMASIFGIKELAKGGYSSYIKTKILLKNIIDLLIMQEKEYNDSNYLSFRKTNNPKMGISNDGSYNDFFVFALSNNIFFQSSKEKIDYMKIQKFNNVICYILLVICLDMTDTTILSLKLNDKLCSYSNYNSVKNKLFDKIKIYTNLDFDSELILNYPVLCYLLYIFSCFLLRYNVWGNKVTDKNSFPKYQLTIINTTVEILNHIITVDAKKYVEKNIYLYDVINRKYFKKLDMFKNKNLIDSLISKFTNVKENDTNIVVHNSDHDIEIDFFKQYEYRENLHYYRYTYKYLLKKIYDDLAPKKDKMLKISNLNTCGKSGCHDFKNKNKQLICNVCGMNANEKEDLNEKYIENITTEHLKKMSKKYCLDGNIHKFKEGICIFCKANEGQELDGEKKLYEMYENVIMMREKNTSLIEKMLEDVKNNNIEKYDVIKHSLDKCIYKFQKNGNDIHIVVDKLLDDIQKIMGKDLYIVDEQYNLYDDIYILTHDLDGKEMSKPEIILNNNQIVKNMNNHPIYKTDAISIILSRNNIKFEAIFDANTLYLLGYRKQGNEFIDSKVDMGCKLKINYSLKNMFLYFGFSRINMSKKDYEYSKNIEMNDFVNRMCSLRFYNIKYMGYLLNKYMSRYSNKYVAILNETIDIYKENQPKQYKLYNNDILDILYNNISIHTIKLSEMVEDKLRIFMKYYSDLYNYVEFKKIDEQLLNNTTIQPDFVLQNDYSSNLILNYIYDEISRLINYNHQDSMTLKNILTFIISLITKVFNNINLTKTLNDNDSYLYRKLLSKTEFYKEYTKSLTKTVEEERLLSLKTMSEENEVLDGEDNEELIKMNDEGDDVDDGVDIDDEDKYDDGQDDEYAIERDD